MKLLQHKLILSSFVAALCITSLPTSQAKESDGQNFVVLFHRGFIDWLWKVPPSADVTNYKITITGGGSDSTFTTTDNYFVPADHGLTNPNNDKQICVTANLSDGWGFGSCGVLAAGKPSGQVINFDGGPSPIYKVNGVFQDSIHKPFEDMKSEPRGIDGKRFAATDSVFLSTNVYYLEPPFTSKSNLCLLGKACVESSRVVSDYWATNISLNFTNATVSTPDTCQVMHTKIKENGETATEIRPLRDNVDCMVTATSHVPFLAKPDATASFTIHFQKLPYSLLAQLPNGEVNPTVGTVTTLQGQQLPQWNWMKERKYSWGAPAGVVLELPSDFRSLTPNTCSIKPSRDQADLLDLRGITVGKCQIELVVPQQRYAGFGIDKYLTSTIISESSTRTFSFNISKPKVISKSIVTKYPCMVADSAAGLYAILNLMNKSAAPSTCQSSNEYIWTFKD